MNKFNKIICFLLLMVILSPLFQCCQVDASTSIAIGDYIQMGKYLGEPILWRCVDIDENGPLILSDKIICFKSFDAAGNHSNDSYDFRLDYGSNNWADSNLRSWLNSIEVSGKVTWACENAPSVDKVKDGYNAYDNEMGFLTNFSSSELYAIKQVTQKTILNYHDSSLATDGNEPHIYSVDYKLSSMVQNYKEAYSCDVTDKIFLPDIIQINKIYENLGDYYIGVPTNQSIKYSNYSSTYCNEDSFWYYWLRDAYADKYYPEGVRSIFPGGHIYYNNANCGYIGVRPAFYLDTNKISFDSGLGNVTNPYIFSGNSSNSPIITVEDVSEPKEYIPIVGTSGLTHVSGQNDTIAIGEYLVMGTYLEQPILWRCVDIDENGPLMLSDKIQCFKAFDAAGIHRNDSKDGHRLNYGSNNWTQSNLRAWLNSIETAGAVVWPCGNEPSVDNVLSGKSPYDNEAGFLGNFTIREQSYIMSVNHKVLLNEIDKDLRTSGNDAHQHRRKVTFLGNYDTAYACEVNDKIFLIDVKQAHTVYENFEDYIMAKPTAQAVENCDYKIDALAESNTWHYWLRDPFGTVDHTEYVRDITTDGRVSADLAYDTRYGVRPAFYLDMTNINFKEGNGSESSPYLIYRHDYNKWTIRNEATCTENGEEYRTCSICGNEEVKDIALTGHTYGGWNITKKDTILKYGEKQQKCSVCSDVITVRAKTSSFYSKLIICSAFVTGLLLLFIGNIKNHKA